MVTTMFLGCPWNSIRNKKENFTTRRNKPTEVKNACAILGNNQLILISVQEKLILQPEANSGKKRQVSTDHFLTVQLVPYYLVLTMVIYGIQSLQVKISHASLWKGTLVISYWIDPWANNLQWVLEKLIRGHAMHAGKVLYAQSSQVKVHGSWRRSSHIKISFKK